MLITPQKHFKHWSQIAKVRRLLKFMSKAKAAKLVRGLVDMFLDMRKEGESGDKEVQLCKVLFPALIYFHGTKYNYFF
jgi:26S proteasome regulatory subunit RPN6 N-terminal domain